MLSFIAHLGWFRETSVLEREAQSANHTAIRASAKRDASKTLQLELQRSAKHQTHHIRASAKHGAPNFSTITVSARLKSFRAQAKLKNFTASMKLKIKSFRASAMLKSFRASAKLENFKASADLKHFRASENLQQLQSFSEAQKLQSFSKDQKFQSFGEAEKLRSFSEAQQLQSFKSFTHSFYEPTWADPLLYFKQYRRGHTPLTARVRGAGQDYRDMP